MTPFNDVKSMPLGGSRQALDKCNSSKLFQVTETKCVVDKEKMLVTALTILVINIEIQSPTSLSPLFHVI